MIFAKVGAVKTTNLTAFMLYYGVIHLRYKQYLSTKKEHLKMDNEKISCRNDRKENIVKLTMPCACPKLGYGHGPRLRDGFSRCVYGYCDHGSSEWNGCPTQRAVVPNKQ
jgi:hypothetical protein